MKRLCPSCGTFIPIWRWSGPIVKYHRQPGSSWFRFTPQHFYCRRCGVELRQEFSPLGRLGFGLMLGLFFVAALAILDFRSWGSIKPNRLYIALLWALCCIPLSLLIARWGTNLKAADGVSHD
jgi:hypothetical protein